MNTEIITLESLFIPVKLAIDLAQCEFYESCIGFYFLGIENTLCQIKTNYDFQGKDNTELESSSSVSAPTWEQVHNWFEEKHRVKVRQIPYTSGKDKWVIWQWNKDKVCWEDKTTLLIEDRLEAIYKALELLNLIKTEE